MGAGADSYAYSAYGQPLSETGSDVNPFRFGGQYGYYTDAALPNGVVLCTYRWYDPNGGRWLSRDPAGYDGGDNLYAYCQDDPIAGNDPDGTDPGGGGAANPYSNVPEAPPGANIFANILITRRWLVMHPQATRLEKYKWYFSMVHSGGPWDFKTQGVHLPKVRRKYPDMTVSENCYDAFGNFNAGAIGKVLGLSQFEVVHGADVVHALSFWSGPSPADHGDTWLNSGYGWAQNMPGADIQNMQDFMQDNPNFWSLPQFSNLPK